jgi:uncharacterized protein
MSLIQLPHQVKQNIDISITAVAAFCDRWQIVEFALFGSVLRDDFRPDSDIDVLTTLSDDAPTTLFDLVNMREELEIMFQRPVDIVLRDGIESSQNYLRKQAILSSAIKIYSNPKWD